jgi:endoglucanase
MGFSSTVTLSSVALAAQLAAACCGCPKAAPVAAAPTDVAASPPSAALTASGAGAVVAVKTCPGAFVPAADGLIDDLEDDNNQIQKIAGRGGYWWAAKDDKGSTIEPAGEMKMTEGGAGGSKYAVHVTGKNAPQGDMAWGTVLGLRLVDGQLYDASKYAGISFFAKAGDKSASSVRLKVADVNSHPEGKVCKDGCWNDFGKDFTFSHDWQEYKVSFAEMKQQEGWGDPRPPSITPSKLVQVAWLMSTPGADFDIWLDDIRFTDCQ